MSGAVVALSGAGLVAASTAHAALPTCDRTAVVSAESPGSDVFYGWVTLPAAKVGGLLEPNCQTGSGSAGKWVSTLQRSLQKCNGQVLDVDGIFGRDTRRAVVNVQNRAHITPDGVYGPKTRSAMKWWTDEGRCRPASELGF